MWSPTMLALVFGVAVSALIYFVFFWPSREPPDDE